MNKNIFQFQFKKLKVSFTLIISLTLLYMHPKKRNARSILIVYIIGLKKRNRLLFRQIYRSHLWFWPNYYTSST